MANRREQTGSGKLKLDRRSLLIGGGAGAGLLVAWAVWPRTYLPNLTADANETLFGAWIKVGTDGHITVAVPQLEMGQGVFTAFPQIIADELGASWAQVGVEPAPLNPLYANALGATTLFETALGGLSDSLRRTYAARASLVLTGGSSSIRNFEDMLRKGGAAARVALCKAAAARWGVDWQACGTADGQVIHGDQKIGFGEIAGDAAGQSVAEPVPLRSGDANRLQGQAVPRLDVPSKVDGSANFAGDIRLPNMVYASIRQGPVGSAGLARVDEAAAGKVPGMRSVVRTNDSVAAVADTWWAADRALEAMRPRFQVPETVVNDDSIAEALTGALDAEGVRIAQAGDLASEFRGARVVSAEYRVNLAVHAAIEPMTCTASFSQGRLSLWVPTQAPALARAAAARATGLSEGDVVIYPVMAGGSFGAKLEHQVAAQAAVIATKVDRPVQLTWSRVEDLRHDRFRPAAAARMTGKVVGAKTVSGWLAKIAAPPTGRQLAERLLGSDPVVATSLAIPGATDPSAVSGAVPPYAIANYAIDHHPADIGVPTGHWRSDSHSYTAFFTESFIDELAHVAEVDALVFRMSMLGGNARLARCLQLAAQLGNWQGGGSGTGQGIACHSFRGSHVALLAEAQMTGRTIKVDRLVAVVDVGRIINPDLVQQQIEGGLIFGLAATLGASTGFTDNFATVTDLADLSLPRLADSPDITIEIVRSDADPGGVGELAVPVVAPAIANAIQAASGVRLRSLPLLSDIE